MTLFVIHEAETADARFEARTLERRIFEECGFVDEYDLYDVQSHFFVAYDETASLVASVRLIEGSPLTPPVLAHGMEIDVDRAKWDGLAADGLIDEFATVVTDKRRRNLPIFLELVRSSYQHSRRRGVTHSIMMTMPERAEKMNRLYQLCYRRVGPDQHYKGEEVVTAPYVLDFSEQESFLREANPQYLHWLLDPSLGGLRYRPHVARKRVGV